MTQPDWDDERFAAAFRARFDRPAPPALARDIYVRIAGTSPSRFGRLRLGRAWAIPAAVVVVLLLATIGPGLGGLDGPAAEPTVPVASIPVATGSGGAPTFSTAPEPPDSILGLQVLSVSAALAIRDADADDREIAVRGWFTPPMLISCRPVGPEPVSPVQLRCPDQITWLTEDAESLVHVVGDRTDGGSPNGPALNPDLDGMDSSWWPDLPQPGQDGGSTPAQVVFIGHFDDRRASLCPADGQTACRDRFVVDQVAWVRGVALEPSVVREVRQAGMVVGSSQADIEAIFANEAPDDPILSMVISDGAEGLPRIEPSLANGQQGLIEEPVVWVVRVLEGDRAFTYIVVDGTDRIYEINPDGEAVNVGGAPQPPSSAESPGPWPPEGAVVVALTSPVGAGEPPVQVAVVDESGRLVGVAEKGAVDASTVYFDGRFGAYAEPGKPGRVHLEWIGGICDSRVTVTVAADLRWITFDMGPQPDCDSIGVGRELVLDFTGTVDVPTIELLDAAATPAPAGRDYELDCGPLGPDTCETWAAEIVAANLKDSPSKRVVSITFSADPCGSYTVTFDDGTGMAADIDCVIPPSPG